MPAPAIRSRLELQGFSCDVGSNMSAVQRWLRWTPGLASAWILAGVVLASPGVLWAFAVVSAVGASFPRHPFDFLYDGVVRPLIDGPELPANPAPRRFAMVVACIWSAAVGLLFHAELAVAGYVAGALLVVAGSLVFLTHFCLGSLMYRALTGLIPGSGAGGSGAGGSPAGRS